MNFGKLGVAALLLALTSGAARAQDTTSLLKTTFETETGGWAAFGDGAKVSVIHDAGKLKEGKGSLLFDYALEKGKADSLYLPVESGKLTKMKSLRFWVRADHVTPLIVTLQEKDGGRYNAVFTAPNEQWQQVELNPDDFTLGTEKTDPKDPDGKLDMDKVETVGIADLSVYFLQSEDPNVAKLFTAPKGAHTLLLSDFTVRSDTASVAGGDKKTVALDGMKHPQLGWLGLGGIEIGAISGKPLDGRSLKATYHQSAGQFVGFLRGLPAGGLSGKTQMEFSVASVKATKLLIQLEERDGGKYNVIVEVPADKERTDIVQSFTDFKPSDDSKDENGKLDLDLVKSVLIIDLGGLVDGADADNTLWVGGLRATTK